VLEYLATGRRDEMSRVHADAFREKYGPWGLVTGAAQGLGAGFAGQLAAHGLDLVIVDVDAVKLASQAEALRRCHGIEVRDVVLDLSREEFLRDLSPAIQGLEIGFLVNNAGLSHIGSFLPQDPEFLLTQLYVNVRAVLLLTHRLGKDMVARGRGGMIIVSSGAALSGSALNAHYAATKAYELILAESLWDELRDRGVDVLGFMPSTTDTPGLRGQNPETKSLRAMSVDECVAEAFAALGRRPSVFVGGMVPIVHRILSPLLPRSAMIRLTSKSIRSMFRDAT
jgi:short-subunit dehydrogenase